MDGGWGITLVRGSALDLFPVPIYDKILFATWDLVELPLSLLRGIHNQLLEILVSSFRSLSH